MCNMVMIRNSAGENIKVADMKANVIEKIIKLAGNCELIDYVYLFGSAVEERCTAMSDIDIAIISDVCDSMLFRNKGYRVFKNELYAIDQQQEYDILKFRTLDELYKRKDFVCRDILEKGKIIYSKPKEKRYV